MLFSIKNLTRLMLVIIVVLAFIAGFYKTSLDAERAKYQKLENKMEKLENRTTGMDF